MVRLRALLTHLLLPVGFVIIAFPLLRTYKEHLLSTWHQQEKRTRVDTLLFDPVFLAWIRTEYLREPDPDRREALKGLAMGGGSGSSWAAYYDTPLDFSGRIGELAFPDANPLFRETEQLLATRHARVIQVGSSSGREIAYLARKFPDLPCIGTDIYPEVIAYAGAHHQAPNLSFQVLSAREIGRLLGGHAGQAAVVISSGSLQYVQPEHLDIFFRVLAAHDSDVLLVEPGSLKDGAPDSLHGSRWRDNFSYTHDYRYYAERAGLETVSSRLIRPYPFPERYPVQYQTIHYFFHGRSR